MNYDPQLTTGLAVFMAIFATFLWGSWFISLKFIKDYPLDGFYITLFITSFILVWAAGFIIDGPALLGNIREVYATDPSRVLVSLACGLGCRHASTYNANDRPVSEPADICLNQHEHRNSRLDDHRRNT
jgi:hypothetical protein